MHTKDLTTGSPMKLILSFMLPLVFGLLFQQVYSMVDTIVVGKFLGVDALAGVGSTGSITFLVLGLCNGVCAGFAIPVAQKFGQRDFDGLRRFVGNMIWLGCVIAAAVTLVTTLLCRQILLWMDTPADTFSYAYDYIFVIFLGIPATMLYNLLSGILRSLGDSKTPLVFLIMCSLLNVVLDIVFILTLNMGVAGAGWATLLSQLISGVLCLYFIVKKFPILHLKQDDLRLRRIINEPARKIGATTVQNVADIAAGLGVSMLEVIEHAPDYPALARASAALGGFWRIYRRLKEAYDTMPLDVFVSEILEITGYRSMLEAEGEEGQTRMENIGQLVSSVKTYADQRGPEASLPGFLEEVALISDIDSYDEGADVVVLMTMHAAKGLEFNYVFIVGLEEGIFPSEMSRYSNEDLEEERRLCYVGITRAKKELYLSCANSRMLFGQTKHNRPSRFLEEIDASLVEVEQSPAAAQTKAMRQRYMQQQNAYLQPEYGAASMRSTVQAGYSARYGGASHGSGASGASRPARQRASVGGGFSTVQAGSAASVPRTEGSGAYRPGDLVEHKVFGRGEVLKVTPVAGDTIVEIRFDTAGVKKTMANYAPLKHISE